MDQIQLYTKINSLPNDIKSEVNDFIDFLMSKKKKELKKKKPKFGCAKGQIYTSSDFDKPLDDFNEYM
ncbi:MAG: type II toxin-antitoxin system VapB family antitoxin [Bacteroidota bacterium]